MPSIKRGLDCFSKETERQHIQEIITYFHDEYNQEIGVIAAEQILDFFQQSMGKDIYNKAIDDTKKLFKKQLESFDIELEVLKRL